MRLLAHCDENDLTFLAALEKSDAFSAQSLTLLELLGLCLPYLYLGLSLPRRLLLSIDVILLLPTTNKGVYLHKPCHDF